MKKALVGPFSVTVRSEFCEAAHAVHEIRLDAALPSMQGYAVARSAVTTLDRKVLSCRFRLFRQ